MDSQHLLDVAPGAWDVFWWTDTDMGAPFYVLEQTGTGTDARMGNFTIHLTCFWTSSDNSGFTTANIIDHYGDILSLDILQPPFTTEFPYDHTIYYYSFDAACGTGKFKGSKGSGNFTFGVSETSSNVMVHKWEGTITLVKGE